MPRRSFIPYVDEHGQAHDFPQSWHDANANSHPSPEAVARAWDVIFGIFARKQQEGGDLNEQNAAVAALPQEAVESAGSTS